MAARSISSFSQSSMKLVTLVGAAAVADESEGAEGPSLPLTPPPIKQFWERLPLGENLGEGVVDKNRLKPLRRVLDECGPAA